MLQHPAMAESHLWANTGSTNVLSRLVQDTNKLLVSVKCYDSTKHLAMGRWRVSEAAAIHTYKTCGCYLFVQALW